MSSETLEQIRKSAKEQNLAMSTYCMRKINTPPELVKIEFLLEELSKKLNQLHRR